MGLWREAQENSQVEKTGRVTYGRSRTGKTDAEMDPERDRHGDREEDRRARQ